MTNVLPGSLLACLETRLVEVEKVVLVEICCKFDEDRTLMHASRR